MGVIKEFLFLRSNSKVVDKSVEMASKQTKTIEIVAGPNGSGKTTFGEAFFKKKKGNSIYINPDAIAAGISPMHASEASFQAGRVMISSIKDAISRNESFAFESTLSGKTWLSILKNAIDNGYELTIYFLFLKSVQKNIERIKQRVQQGGHLVPSNAVRRRYPRSFYNFWIYYKPLCKDWYVFDNSSSKAKLIYSLQTFAKLTPFEQQRFESGFLKGKIK